MLPFLPYGRQTIEDDDIAAVAAVLRHGLLTTGPEVEAFEQEFAAATGATHAVACNSGTAALHLAAMALDLGPGDIAIAPAITFLASANAARMCGAEVVFADVDPNTGLMTPATLQAAINRARNRGGRLRVALPVHLNGRMCAMAGLAAIAAAEGIALVEDACHALGVRDVGATRHSAFACFSTHPVKGIATGEGGLVTTADAAAATRMRRLRSHGMVREPGDFVDPTLSCDAQGGLPWAYEMQALGWNYRMPDLLCALGRSQLRKLPRLLARRQAIAALYDRLLAPLSPILRPVNAAAVAGDTGGESGHGHHLYAVLIDFAAAGISRAALMRVLAGEDRIGTQVHYIPVPYQPYYRALGWPPPLPGADAYFARCLSLPFYPLMRDDDVVRVVDALARRLGIGAQGGG